MPADIDFKKGLAAGIPTLASGEPGWTTDTHKLYLGTGAGNVLVGPLSAGDLGLGTMSTQDADDIDVTGGTATLDFVELKNGSGRLKLLTDNLSAPLSLTFGTELAGTDVDVEFSGNCLLEGTNTGNVTLGGSYDYLTIAGQIITLGQIDLTTDVSGLLPPANGGTGLDTSATVANRYLYTSGVGTWTTGTISSTAIGLLSQSSESAMRTALGLAIGTDVQAYSTRLTNIAGLTIPNDSGIYWNNSGTLSTFTLDAFGLTLAATTTAAAARTALGLGSLAILSTVSDSNWSGTDLAIANGGTGASTAADARTNLGLGALATLATVGTSQIDSDAVTYSKIQDVTATSRVLGRVSSGSGIVEELTPAQVRTVAQVHAAKLMGGRITTENLVPVSTADRTAQSTLYLCPYEHDLVGLYSGSAWVPHEIGTGISLALSGLTSGRPYDVFCYSNSGTATLEFLVWTSGTARATGLAYQDGVLVKSSDSTRRYIGTFYTTGTTTTADSMVQRYVWNYYNRVTRPIGFEEATSHSYGTASFRAWNNAASTYRVEFVLGVAEDAICAGIRGQMTPGSGATPVMRPGLDTTTAPAVDGTIALSGTTTMHEMGGGPVSYYPGTAGYHYVAVCEYSSGASTTFTRCGLMGSIRG